MSFLPTDYKVPTESNYMRFKQGPNRFRALSSVITGMEYWIETKEGRKPVRKRMDENIDIAEVPNPEEVRHFWAFAIWNYDEERIQILEVTQKSIQKAIKIYTEDEDWGNPVGVDGYDIVVNREGEGLETDYEVTTKPKKKLDEAIMVLYKDMSINLEALYEGEDPFARPEEK